MSETAHDETLRRAFDGQAAKFERAPVQTNPEALARLAAFAGFEPGALILDAGCGPGLVSAELAKHGARMFGTDLSSEMVDRARTRCPSGEFRVGSLFDEAVAERAPFDGAISRYVLHHVPNVRAFVERQAQLVRPGGAVVLCDHTTGPDPRARLWHQEVERDRDKSHTNCLTPAEIVDVFVAAGLVDLRFEERSYLLDFDEWFDRGTPRQPKAVVRARLLAGPSIRGFEPTERTDGGVDMRLWMTTIRGVKPL